MRKYFSSKTKIVFLILSLVFSISFFLIWPYTNVWDDAGMGFRYLDNFSEGYFFSFNIEDGPVFGMSGFIHGILAGSLSYLGILTPVQSAYCSNFLGLFLISFITFLILERYLRSWQLCIPAWLLVMLSGQYFLINIKQGLETPLHLSILLSAIFLFLINRKGWLYFFCALSIISKLDGAAVAGTLVLSSLISHWPLFKENSFRNRHVLSLLVWGAGPLLIWGLWAWWVFGSPLPLSAYTKFFVQASPETSPLVYFIKFIGIKERSIFIIFSGIVCLTGWITGLVKSRVRLPYNSAVFHCCFFLLLSYCFFNPRENMSWYYSVPEFLLVLQTVVCIFLFINYVFRSRELASVFVVWGTCCLSLAFFFPSNLKYISTIMSWVERVEGERVTVGKWIKKHSAKGDKLLTGFGHIGRESGLYVYDLSGLNSRPVVKIGAVDNAFKGLRLIRPDWFVSTRIIPIGIKSKICYELVNQFYDHSSPRGGRHGSWKVYKGCRTTPQLVEQFIDPEFIFADGQLSKKLIRNKFRKNNKSLMVIGTDIVFHMDKFATKNGILHFGIVREGRPYTIKIQRYMFNGEESPFETRTVLSIGSESDASRFTQSVSIAYQGGGPLKGIGIERASTGQQKNKRLVLIAPLLQIRIDDSTGIRN